MRRNSTLVGPAFARAETAGQREAARGVGVRQGAAAAAAIAAFAAFGPVAVAQAATLYVTPSGTGTSCTQASPCDNLDEAYRAASPGDTVEVAAGAYPNQSVGKDTSKAIGSAKVTLRAMGNVTMGEFTTRANDVHFIGFKLPTGKRDGDSPDGVALVRGGRNVILEDFVGTKSYVWGPASSSATADTINGLTIKNGNWGPHSSCGGGAQITADGPPKNITLEGNTYHDFSIRSECPSAHLDCVHTFNGIDGLVLRGNRFVRCQHFGALVNGASNVVIENNMFEGGIYGFKLRGDSSPTIEVFTNLVIRHNSADIMSLGSAGSNTLNNAVVEGNAAIEGIECRSGVTFRGNLTQNSRCTGDLPSANPGFASAANGDFHVTSSSPLVDRLAGGPARDWDGDVRPWGSAYDVGADEVAGTGPPPPPPPPPNAPPSATFTRSPASPQTGQTVTFTSTATDSDGTIASQSWDTDNDGAFDDGTASTATATYATAGSKTVRLRTVDDDGAATVGTMTFSVAAPPPPNQPPSASFTWSPTAPAIAQTVTFTSTSTDGDGIVASQSWDTDNDGAFDDGTSTTATATYATTGTKTVRLRVVDDDGDSAVATQTFTVSATPPPNQPPSASFTRSPASPAAGQPVTFTSTSTDSDGTIASQSWDTDNDGAFDDGTATTATATYATAGSKTVRLRAVDDDGAANEATMTFSVSPPNQAPAAQFSWSPTSPETGQTVTFASNSTDGDGTIATHRWDTDNDGSFDDGTATTATRTFTSAGSKTVRLRVTDDDGATNTISKTVTVSQAPIVNLPPLPSFTWSPATPLAGDTVSLTSNSSDSDGSIASTAWDLDDDGAYDDATGSTASRVFAAAGTYVVGLRVTDDRGASTTTERAIVVAPVLVQLPPTEGSSVGTPTPVKTPKPKKPRRSALTVRASLATTRLKDGALVVSATCNRPCRLSARLKVRGAPRMRSAVVRKLDRGKGALMRVRLPERVYGMASRRAVRVVVLVTAKAKGRSATARQPVRIKSG